MGLRQLTPTVPGDRKCLPVGFHMPAGVTLAASHTCAPRQQLKAASEAQQGFLWLGRRPAVGSGGVHERRGGCSGAVPLAEGHDRPAVSLLAPGRRCHRPFQDAVLSSSA